MNLAASLGIAIGLCMDNFAVTIVAGGLYRGTIGRWRVFKTSSCFMLAHIVMLYAGWLGGTELGRYIGGWANWVACLVLLLVGVHMLYQAFFCKDDCPAGGGFSFQWIMGLALATSLDALWVGIALPLERIPLAQTLWLMAVFVFLTSCVGFWLGKILGRRFGKVMEIGGGLILMGMGVKILLRGIGIL